MRIPGSVLRWLSAGILVLAGIVSFSSPALADTGTYRIDDYTVTLEPQENGQVRITIDQTWEVLSGDIPWITVGLPNSKFSIKATDGNVASISAENSGGFTGVRITLDKDYRPGETFHIRFTVLQSNLLERLTSEKKWRIDYTPGWYDRAETGHMEISLISPVAYETYSSVSPAPDSTAGDVIRWEKYDLGEGQRFTIKVESLDGSFLTSTLTVESGDDTDWSFIIFIIFLIGIGGLLVWGVARSRRIKKATLNEQLAAIEQKMAVNEESRKKIEDGFDKYVEKENLEPDEEGRYYDRSYGGYITPAIWAATIMNRSSRSSATHHSTCACACVSCACACACACAGGGAAGCSRKSLHECNTCLPAEDKTPSEDQVSFEVPGR